MNHDILERLNAIKARCAKARLGPWKAFVEGRDHTSGSSFIMIGDASERDEDLHLLGYDVPVPTDDYDFIANARADIPFLLNEIDRLNQLLKKA